MKMLSFFVIYSKSHILWYVLSLLDKIWDIMYGLLAFRVFDMNTALKWRGLIKPFIFLASF